jgi:hypothetical protein
MTHLKEKLGFAKNVKCECKSVLEEYQEMCTGYYVI